MSDPNIVEKASRRPTDQERADQKAHDTPRNREEKLEAGLEDSMDASDPPSTTAPGDHGDPVPSSGFPESPPKK